MSPAAASHRRLGFCHADPRVGVAWCDSRLVAGRWHCPATGAASYFYNTPTAAWADFIRQQGARRAEDLLGMRRAMWAVDLSDVELVRPALADDIMLGGAQTIAACQAEATRLVQGGARGLQAPADVLRESALTAWRTGSAWGRETRLADPAQVWVIYGAVTALGWLVVEAGAPTPEVLEMVRHE